MKQITFIRWGELNPIKHKETRKLIQGKEYDMETGYSGFHVAPAFKGIYAFPEGYVEEFLICSPRVDDEYHFLKDENGNRIKDEDFWDYVPEKGMVIRHEYKGLVSRMGLKTKDFRSSYVEEEDECYIKYTRMKAKKFKYDGEIWHHLSEFVDHYEILDSKGGWIKTDMKTYAKALERCDMTDRFSSYIDLGREVGTKGNPHTFPANFSKDHYEVFIEKVK